MAWSILRSAPKRMTSSYGGPPNQRQASERLLCLRSLSKLRAAEKRREGPKAAVERHSSDTFNWRDFVRLW